LARLLDILEIDVVDVLGYSWGGVLAQQFARDLPERVRALVLASTNFGFGAVPSPELLPLLNLTLSEKGDDPWKLLTAALGGAPGSRNPVGAIVNALNPTTSPVEGYQRQLLALTGWTSLCWLHELTGPTLVVCGDDDPYVPTSTSRKLVQSIPGARLELIRGGGHLMPINQPTKLAQAVESFLGRLDTQR
jgi:pimeloyl-ACP methyl ester carboxylesterase